jgi:hypothetical protein
MYLIYLSLLAAALRLHVDHAPIELARGLVLAAVPVAVYGTFQSLGLDVYEWGQQEGGPQVFATLGNANFFAAFLGIVTPVSRLDRRRPPATLPYAAHHGVGRGLGAARGRPGRRRGTAGLRARGRDAEPGHPGRQDRSGRRRHTVVAALRYTGMRSVELRSLRLDDLDLDRGEVMVRSKSAAARPVLIPRPLRPILQTYLDEIRPVTPVSPLLLVNAHRRNSTAEHGFGSEAIYREVELAGSGPVSRDGTIPTAGGTLMRPSSSALASTSTSCNDCWGTGPSARRSATPTSPSTTSAR